MAVRASEQIRVALPVGDEEVTLTFPGWSDPKMAEAIKKLLRGRQSIRRNQVKDTSTEARVAFFDGVCLDVENFEEQNEAGEWVTCNAETFPDWKDRIPESWKVSAATYFEEKNILTADDVKN